MMMNRERIGFWVRLLAIVLAVFFIGSFIFVGLGTNISYNLFDLLGGSDQQQTPQTTGTQEQIQQAEKQLEKNPNDPTAIKQLAALYAQNGRLDDAARVLEKGRKVAPKDAEIATLLGQVYSQQAQATPGDKQDQLYEKAGDAYAAATRIEPDNGDIYLLAGGSYDQAGDPAQAIKYYNEYLDHEPQGQQAKAVKNRISALIEGGETTGG
jgi:cytochrome c-type biogenesis protein CcmH/NrfG